MRAALAHDRWPGPIHVSPCDYWRFTYPTCRILYVSDGCSHSSHWVVSGAARTGKRAQGTVCEKGGADCPTFLVGQPAQRPRAWPRLLASARGGGYHQSARWPHARTAAGAQGMVANLDGDAVRLLGGRRACWRGSSASSTGVAWVARARVELGAFVPAGDSDWETWLSRVNRGRGQSDPATSFGPSRSPEPESGDPPATHWCSLLDRFWPHGGPQDATSESSGAWMASRLRVSSSLAGRVTGSVR